MLPTMDEGERRKYKAAKLDMGDGKRKDGATGFMVKSGNVMRSILLEKASRAQRKSSARPWGVTQTSSQHLHIRRARLNDLGPDAGSNMYGRDKVWTKAPMRFSRESRKGFVGGPVDGNGYRASRFYEYL